MEGSCQALCVRLLLRSLRDRQRGLQVPHARDNHTVAATLLGPTAIGFRAALELRPRGNVRYLGSVGDANGGKTPRRRSRWSSERQNRGRSARGPCSKSMNSSSVE